MTNTTAPRRGRPRRKPRSTVLPPGEEILRVAARLFAEKGFAGTSTREIANEAGLQQPTLFHYFPTKDDILRAVSERALLEPLAALESIAEEPLAPSVKLYLVVWSQTRHLCSQPFDLSAILQEASYLSPERFPEWHAGANRYTSGLQALIEEGVTSGELVMVDTLAATMMILGMCNWTGRWYRKGGRLTPDALATEFASMAVRALLTASRDLPAIRNEAMIWMDAS